MATFSVVWLILSRDFREEEDEGIGGGGRAGLEVRRKGMNKEEGRQVLRKII